jgi:two-component system, NarL family, response regulator DevR
MCCSRTVYHRLVRQENAAAAMARMPALRPDVVVLDVRLLDGDGLTVRRDLRAADPRL